MRWGAAGAAAMLLALGGCGLGLFEDESGGANNLPTEGAGPYGKPDIDFDTLADEPYVVADNRASLVDPAALGRDDGGFRLWFAREPDNTVDESEIWRAELPSVFDLPDLGPEQVLTPEGGWEEARVAAPAVVAGPDGNLVMFYEGGSASPGIGRADSTDGGATWTKHASNPVLLGATNPTVGYADGEWVMYMTDPATPGIFRATSSDGVSWTRDADPVITARTGENDAFDRDAVGDPFVLVERTVVDRLHYGLFFTGTQAGDDITAIGYAGSFDGVVWERFAGLDPVLHPGLPNELGPTAVLRASQGFLFFHEKRSGRDRITVAIHP